MTIRQRQEMATLTPKAESTRLGLPQSEAVLHEPVLVRVSTSGFVFRAFLCAMLCASSSARGEPTVGQQFRDIMAEIDAKCRKEKLGPYLDPKEPPRSAKRTDGSCEILKIKPADPLATEEGRFAYSIKLPPPHDKPKVEYKKGMSAETYFKELCEKEAGDFVFRTVDGIEGITLVRPSAQSYASLRTEMPTNNYFANYEGIAGSFISSINGKYLYFDAVEFVSDNSLKTQLAHYYLNKDLPQNKSPYRKERKTIKNTSAKYGYTYRATKREQALENGISGGELIILDIQTKEILAFRRTFYREEFAEIRSPEHMRVSICKSVPIEKRGATFITEVLRPINFAEGNKE